MLKVSLKTNFCYVCFLINISNTDKRLNYCVFFVDTVNLCLVQLCLLPTGGPKEKTSAQSSHWGFFEYSGLSRPSNVCQNSRFCSDAAFWFIKMYKNYLARLARSIRKYWTGGLILHYIQCVCVFVCVCILLLKSLCTSSPSV